MRTSIHTCVVAAVMAALTGCASSEKSSPEIQTWARQNIADAHAKEVADLKAENARIAQEAETHKQIAVMSDWVTTHQKESCEKLRATYAPHAQGIFNAYGFKGEVLDYGIIEARVYKRHLIFTQIFIWRASDGSGGVLRISLAENLISGEYDADKVDELRRFTARELVAFLENPSAEQQVAQSKPDGAPESKWSPDKETINTGYKALIGLGAAAAFSLFNSN